MNLRWHAAGLLLCCLVGSAFAQDAQVLSGWDDVAFAEKLRECGYPDLAAPLLNVIEGAIGSANDEAVLIRRLRLDLAEDETPVVGEAVRRRDALLDVLAAKERFVDEFRFSSIADATRDSLPDLYLRIGETIVEILKSGTGTAVPADAVSQFVRAEEAFKARVAKLKSIESPTDEDQCRLEVARYYLARTIHFHAMVFPPKSEERLELMQAALAEYDAYDIDYGGGDDPSIFTFYANVECGLCLAELGKVDDALKKFDLTIALRECWGPADERTGVFPLPTSARDVVDLIAYAAFRKAIVLRDAKRLDEVVAVGKAYFDSMPRPFDATSAQWLAKEYGEALLSAGSTDRLDALAARMIEADPDGDGARWARELLARAHSRSR